jgi:hypothetical protein
MPLSAVEVQSTVLAQIQVLDAIAKAEGVRLMHVKPHGALYNHAAVTLEIANAIASAISQYDSSLVLFGLAGSALIDAGVQRGLCVMGEAFADRAYEADGTLRSRTLGGALIEDDEQCLAQVLRVAQRGEVIAHDGSVVKIDAQTICLHSDTAGAARRAAFLHAKLRQHGVALSPIARHCPECGALLSDADSCSTYFDQCLALEFSDARYGAVHHLTVPAYFLQHPSRLSRDGWQAMRETLRAFVIDGKTPAQMRSVSATAAKNISLKKGASLMLQQPVQWRKTIADVQLDDPVCYCADVQNWAAATLEDAVKIDAM